MSAVELTEAEHVARLERDVSEFARHLTEAQEAGVSHAVLLPRMMLAFRANFGEMPAGLPAWPAIPNGSAA